MDSIKDWIDAGSCVGRQQAFPEVDRAAWFTAAEALRKINKGQAPIVRQLIERLGG